MKYRFSLARKQEQLELTAKKIDSELFSGEVITTLIIEDFTTAEYFLSKAAGIFSDGHADSSRDVLNASWVYNETNLVSVVDRLNRLASPLRYGPTADSYMDLIGRTPLLKLNSLARDCGAIVLVKLESMEPGSVKDRSVKSMIEQAIKRNEISDDTEVIEASSGNVAFAMSAIMAALLNKKPKIFISKMHGPPKRKAVRASGAPIILTSFEGGSYGSKIVSIEYAEKHKAFQLN